MVNQKSASVGSVDLISYRSQNSNGQTLQSLTMQKQSKRPNKPKHKFTAVSKPKTKKIRNIAGVPSRKMVLRTMMKLKMHRSSSQTFHPNMLPYLKKWKGHNYVFDLIKTQRALSQTCRFLMLRAAQGQKFLFVSTQKVKKNILAEAAEKCNSPYVNNKWLGGILTNWKTVRSSIMTLNKLDHDVESKELLKLPKKEQSMALRHRQRLEKTLGGLKTMRRLPNVLLVFGQQEEWRALREVEQTRIPPSLQYFKKSRWTNKGKPSPTAMDAKEAPDFTKRQRKRYLPKRKSKKRSFAASNASVVSQKQPNRPVFNFAPAQKPKPIFPSMQRQIPTYKSMHKRNVFCSAYAEPKGSFPNQSKDDFRNYEPSEIDDHKTKSKVKQEDKSPPKRKKKKKAPAETAKSKPNQKKKLTLSQRQNKIQQLRALKKFTTNKQPIEKVKPRLTKLSKPSKEQEKLDEQVKKKKFKKITSKIEHAPKNLKRVKKTDPKLKLKPKRVLKTQSSQDGLVKTIGPALKWRIIEQLKVNKKPKKFAAEEKKWKKVQKSDLELLSQEKQNFQRTMADLGKAQLAVKNKNYIKHKIELLAKKKQDKIRLLAEEKQLKQLKQLKKIEKELPKKRPRLKRVKKVPLLREKQQLRSKNHTEDTQKKVLSPAVKKTTSKITRKRSQKPLWTRIKSNKNFSQLLRKWQRLKQRKHAINKRRWRKVKKLTKGKLRLQFVTHPANRGQRKFKPKPFYKQSRLDIIPRYRPGRRRKRRKKRRKEKRKPFASSKPIRSVTVLDQNGDPAKTDLFVPMSCTQNGIHLLMDLFVNSIQTGQKVHRQYKYKKQKQREKLYKQQLRKRRQGPPGPWS